MNEIILTLGIIGFIFIWFYYGYKGANLEKDSTKYLYSLVLQENAWKKSDQVFYYFCIISGLISYFCIRLLGDVDILKVYLDKKFYIGIAKEYADMASKYNDNSYLKISKRYLERIEKFEQEIEAPYMKKYKIDPCSYCSKIKECCFEHYDFKLCNEFRHIRALY